MITFGSPQSIISSLLSSVSAYSFAIQVVFPGTKVIHLINLSDTDIAASRSFSNKGRARIKSIVIV